MLRRLLHLVLLFSLIFQGIAAVGAAVPGHGPQQHCAGHSAHQTECACCPDGMSAGVSCTVQCSVTQAPVSLCAPAWLTSYGVEMARHDFSIANPSYLPIVPPPIA